jgi:hypothetical protein
MPDAKTLLQRELGTGLEVNRLLHCHPSGQDLEEMENRI